jgi:hypothetical protein
MSLAGWITLGLVLVTVAGVAGLVTHHLGPPREKRPRGAEPGQGDTWVYAKERIAFLGIGNEDAAGRITRVPRDPQAYARGMVPGHARRKERR